MSKFQECPRQGTREFIVQDLESGEVIAYDTTTHEAHCLNPVAATVWKAIDGETGTDAIAQTLDAPLDEAKALTDEALRQLADHGMVDWVAPPVGMSRRQALGRAGAGIAAALAVPMILSIVAPTPAEADTCIASGGACTSDAQCCSGRCVGNTCL